MDIARQFIFYLFTLFSMPETMPLRRTSISFACLSSSIGTGVLTIDARSLDYCLPTIKSSHFTSRELSSTYCWFALKLNSISSFPSLFSRLLEFRFMSLSWSISVRSTCCRACRQHFVSRYSSLFCFSSMKEFGATRGGQILFELTSSTTS